MRKMLIAAALVLPLAACTTTERTTTAGAVSGGIIGGAISGDFGGAAIGAIAGGIAGALIGQANEPGRCVYRNREGRRYVAACRPAGQRR
ncbi:glycine zipper 2TM domain-containing protein [Pararhizobium sp.]|uniref:glycine zipper 2TM domain-containing protein n=1 Tax=Pararhizobium sp. TaxID=1977563 RepID=UPI002725820A|nr:glycine zipper 2TM domain-containing protein [Pararhizobium sp.]MDO9418327.1 glycine zipper domain-containing protein [Pararhizobium sp.]